MTFSSRKVDLFWGCAFGIQLLLFLLLFILVSYQDFHNRKNLPRTLTEAERLQQLLDPPQEPFPAIQSPLLLQTTPYTIYGVLRDSNGDSIADATVFLFTQDPTQDEMAVPVRITQSRSNGTFRFRNLEKQTYYLNGTAEGFRPRSQPVTAAEPTAEPVSYTLYRLISKTGTVTDDSGAPLEAAQVTIKIQGGGYDEVIQESILLNGVFEFILDESQTYHIQAQRESYHPASTHGCCQDSEPVLVLKK